MYVRISISKKEMQEVINLASKFNLETSKPFPLSSASESLNSPLSGQDIIQVIEVVSVVFSAGTSILNFIESFKKLLKEKKMTAEISTEKEPMPEKVDGDSEISEIMKKFDV